MKNVLVERLNLPNCVELTGKNLFRYNKTGSLLWFGNVFLLMNSL